MHDILTQSLIECSCGGKKKDAMSFYGQNEYICYALFSGQKEHTILS